MKNSDENCAYNTEIKKELLPQPRIFRKALVYAQNALTISVFYKGSL